jgi:GntR family transcriptional regulator, transcriptional repressor for pyruvate dehydrogenase complex
MPQVEGLHPDQDDPQSIHRRLRSMIDAGLVGADGRLPTERALSKTLGVGRRAIRTAFEILESEGLIWRRQGKGTFIGQEPEPHQVLAAGIVGATTVLEVMEARLVIEPALAGIAARHASPDDVVRLRGLARRAVEGADPASLELWDGALHRLIARTAGNKPLLTAFGMIDEIRANPEWRGLRSRVRSPETLRVSNAEHLAIIDRIEMGDEQGAAAAMRAHLTTLSQNLARMAEDKGDVA